MSNPVTGFMLHVRDERHLNDCLRALAHEGRVIGFTPAHGFTGYYYFLVETPDAGGDK